MLATLASKVNASGRKLVFAKAKLELARIRGNPDVRPRLAAVLVYQGLRLKGNSVRILKRRLSNISRDSNAKTRAILRPVLVTEVALMILLGHQRQASSILPGWHTNPGGRTANGKMLVLEQSTETGLVSIFAVS